MNMQGISNSSFTNINNALFEAYEKADDLSIQKACQETKDEPTNLKTDDGMTICRIHIDSSWQKRGHSSMNGYVAGISNGKVTDNPVMSKYCKQCQIWKHKKDTDEYKNWKSTHICSINHQKSSGAMQSAGAIELFRRSVSTNNLIYSEYFGDGDNSSFADAVASKTYEKYNIDPETLECIGHVQKKW